MILDHIFYKLCIIVCSMQNLASISVYGISQCVKIALLRYKEICLSTSYHNE